MSLFLDEIEHFKLYRKRFYMPIRQEDRRKGSVVFLLSRNLQDSCKLINHPLRIIDPIMFQSYYTERDVMFYINEAGYIQNKDTESILSESLTKSERDSIPKEDFGLEDERKFPLDTPAHVKSAIRLFGHCPEERKHELAVKIIAKAKKFDIEIKEDSEVYKYAHNKQSKLSEEQYEMLKEQYEPDKIKTFKTISEGYQIFNDESCVANFNGNQFRIFFDDTVENILNEKATMSDSEMSIRLKKFLYNDRIKNQKQQIQIYDQIKKLTYIKYTYLKFEMYKKKNMFIDLAYYTNLLLQNNTTYKLDSAVDLFLELIAHSINDKRLAANGYTKKTMLINLDSWIPQDTTKNIWDFRSDINPISVINRLVLRRDIPILQNKWGDTDIVFLTNNMYFGFNVKEFQKTSDLTNFHSLIKKLLKNDTTNVEPETNDSSEQVLVSRFVDKVENAKGVRINNISGKLSPILNTKENNPDLTTDNIHDDIDSPANEEKKKTELVKMIKKNIEDNNVSNDDELYDSIDNSSEMDKEKISEILDDIQSDDAIKINKTRQMRLDKLNKDMLTKKIGNRSIKEMLSDSSHLKELPKDNIKVDNINEEWKNVTFTNFSKAYDLEADIVAVFSAFINKTRPLSIVDISKENTSTSEDYIDTWKVTYEDDLGTRSTIKVDIPRMIENRYMKLRGNLKTIQGQLVLLPIIKTDIDASQIVTNYNKIFIYRSSKFTGTKSTKSVSIIVKLANMENKTFKLVPGDNSKISNKYEVPYDYSALSKTITRIEFFDGSYFSFNLDDMNELAKKLGISETNGRVFYYYDAIEKKIYSYDQINISTGMLEVITKKANKKNDKDLLSKMQSITASDKLDYSYASILRTDIPTIVVMAYSVGLQKAMEIAKIEYEFQDKRVNYMKKDVEHGYVKLKDGYIVYKNTLAAGLLMNGLAYTDLENYSIKDINERSTWLEILDDFGGKIKSDGLDNFYELMFDPITMEICDIFKLPKDYIESLAYASSLLVDTKYNRHTDITGNRMRTTEIVAAYLYKVMANAYGSYNNQRKRARNGVKFSIKQSALIDAILADPTASDLSVLTPLMEAEANNTYSFKGLSGLNSERSYSLDKRIFDESMVGIMAEATGFSGNTGTFRQSTVNASVKTTRGFINTAKDMTTLNTLSVTEALTPLSTTHDDSIRSAMNFIQTAKHQMLVKRSTPNLVTTGMDEAIAYTTSNMYSHKFRGQRGKVIAINKEFIIYEDLDTHVKEYVSLKKHIEKNSDGGFYIRLQLSPRVKVGQILHNNDIVAYDKKFFTNIVGGTKANANMVTANTGTLAKICVGTTAGAFNDSTMVTQSLSEALTFNYVVKKEVYIPKDANIYNMITPGSHVEEGQTLLIFQNAFDDADANKLLKVLTDGDKDNNDGELTDIGRIPIHSKVTGTVQGIKIYRTCEINELSPTIKKYVKEYESKIEEEKKFLIKNKIDEFYKLDPNYKLSQTGKLKNVDDGIMIEFYLEVEDRYGVGDKLVQQNALKGVCMDIFPVGKEPTSEYRPDEIIESVLSAPSIAARMTGSIVIIGLLNKILIELDRQCKDLLGIKWKYLYEMTMESGEEFNQEK